MEYIDNFLHENVCLIFFSVFDYRASFFDLSKVHKTETHIRLHSIHNIKINVFIFPKKKVPKTRQMTF